MLKRLLITSRAIHLTRCRCRQWVYRSCKARRGAVYWQSIHASTPWHLLRPFFSSDPLYFCLERKKKYVKENAGPLKPGVHSNLCAYCKSSAVISIRVICSDIRPSFSGTLPVYVKVNYEHFSFISDFRFPCKVALVVAVDVWRLDRRLTI